MPEGFNDLIRLNKSYIKSASKLLARAFQDDPVPAYFFPDEEFRFPKYLRECLIHLVAALQHVSLLRGLQPKRLPDDLSHSRQKASIALWYADRILNLRSPPQKG